MYTVTVTDAQGCSAATTIMVSQDITIPVISLTKSNDLTCIQTWASLSVDNLGSNPVHFYLWNTGALMSNISVTAPGTYTVTATNAFNGCTSTASMAVIQDIMPPTPSLSASTTTLTCGTTATLTASGGDTYYWYGNNNFQASGASVTVSDGGVYTVVATSATNGCTSSSTISISGYGSPIINFSPSNGLLCSGVPLFVSPAAAAT